MYEVGFPGLKGLNTGPNVRNVRSGLPSSYCPAGLKGLNSRPNVRSGLPLV